MAEIDPRYQSGSRNAQYHGSQPERRGANSQPNGPDNQPNSSQSGQNGSSGEPTQSSPSSESGQSNFNEGSQSSPEAQGNASQTPSNNVGDIRGQSLEQLQQGEQGGESGQGSQSSNVSQGLQDAGMSEQGSGGSQVKGAQAMKDVKGVEGGQQGLSQRKGPAQGVGSDAAHKAGVEHGMAQTAESGEQVAAQAGAQAQGMTVGDWFHMGAQFLGEKVSALGHGIGNFISNALGWGGGGAAGGGAAAAATGGAATAGGATAAATAGAVTTAAAGASATGTVTTSLVSVILAVAVTVASMVIGSGKPDDPLVDPCATHVKNAAVSAMEDINVDARVEQQCKLAYSVMKTMGIPNENIAGVLGNWCCEGGMDPTSVETIFSEPWTMGPRKKQAEADGFAIEKIDAAYAAQYPAIDIAGIGFAGWTNGNNTKLRAYADAMGKPWYSFDVQLVFAIAPVSNGGYRDFHIKDGKNWAGWEQEATPEAAALHFADAWEGNNVLAQQERQDKAKYWFTKMASWDVDQAYANSIITMAGVVVGAAGDKNTFRAMQNCDDVSAVNNSTIAWAAVSYAYPKLEDGYNNNGTSLYQEVHDAIFPGDIYYRSCDRSVACAVRWSGADDNFPAGGCSNIGNYLIGSKKWKEITNWAQDPNNLEPGDVLLWYGEHIYVYVGHDTIAAKWPNEHKNCPVSTKSVHESSSCEMNCVSGSIGAGNSPTGDGARSPGVTPWYWESNLQNYKVYRNIEKEANSLYKTVAGGTLAAEAMQLFGPSPTPTPTPDPHATPTPVPSPTPTPDPHATPAPTPTPRPTTGPIVNPNDHGADWTPDGGDSYQGNHTPTPKPSASPGH